jgi:ribosomal protein S21
MSLTVRVRHGEPIGAALARFRRVAKRGGLLRDIRRANARYSPPSVEKTQQAQRRKTWKKKHKHRG